MNYSADEKALIWLCACTGLEHRERVALLRAAPSPEALFSDFGKFYREVIKKEDPGLYKEGSLSFRRKETEETLALMEKEGYFAVTLLSEDYPEPLKLPAALPPLVLFGKGNRSLLAKRKFCVVGSRVTPSWAQTHGAKIAERLSAEFAIVTGLAEGGDSAAIRGALPGGNLIVVLPCGLGECYPAAHASLKEEIARSGLLLSERPFREKLRKHAFYERNRILAALSEGVLLLSAGEKSGALITAGYAADYGRDVFAFPYSLGVAQGVGTNELIKKGAYLCTCAEDILFNYGMTPGRETAPALNEEERALIAALHEVEEAHTAQIAERTGMKVYEVAAILSSLELKGLVVKSGSNRYRAV